MLGVRGRPVHGPPGGEGRVAGRPVAAAARHRGGPRRGRARRRAGEQVLRRPGRHLHAAAAGAHRAVVLGHHRRPRRRRVRDHELACSPRGARLGVPHRHRVGLGHRAGPAARVARREGCCPVGRTRPVRPGDRPVQPVAHHPRVGRARHRVRPGDRLRGRVRRHQLRHAGPARHPALRLAAHARHRRPHPPARPRDHRLRRRRCRHQAVGPRPRRDPGRLPARPHLRPTPGPGPQQRLRLRRLPAPRAAAADGQRVAAAGHRRRPLDGRPDRRRGRRDLRRRRPVVVDRHAAGELPVHRPAVLPHPRRPARRAAARRRLPGAHHRVLGIARRPRRPVDVAGVRCA